ncbi:S8 family serine peptidase [Dinoroseobacter sp. S76]|uniref:S8 family serine peptidase n=1 Tax=Dinoroseobacter sp. S76 TaxID=3415124 RepID=UPI003C7D91C6
MRLNVTKEKAVDLEELDDVGGTGRHGREFGVSVGEDSARLSELINNAAHSHFEMPHGRRLVEEGSEARAAADRVRPALFRERDSQLLRVVYKEIVVEFTEGAEAATRKAILEKYGLEVRRRSGFNPNRFVVTDPKRSTMAQKTVEVSNDLMQLEEVETASPNFVSEFPRRAAPVPSRFQWHLNHQSGQSHDPAADVDIRAAWQMTQGAPQVVVAVLDDGVDVEHPNLRENILRRPDPDEPRDVNGRDFYIADNDDPEHYNPRPKLFRHPYDQMPGNDIHGTPCAGVIASTGRLSKVFGAAPFCSILPVKIFHADFLAAESRVADAITYAALFADILSCSWSGPDSALINQALRHAAGGSAELKRGVLGTPSFFATGNSFSHSVAYPAADESTIAVGATTDQARIAGYSNQGPEVWVTAPSSGGQRGIMTTDVSYNRRGFNLGAHADGGTDGFHTNDFGGTSSATPLVAGVAALMLSVASHLTVDQVKAILRDTADPIGTGYTGAPPHSPAYGYGRINAGAAVAAAMQA